MAVCAPTRRTFIKSTALAAGATMAAPYIKTAHSAGRLNVGFWDHWVPGANDVMRQLVEQWAQENNVDVTLDFITSTGQKILITAAAESRARTGHDILAQPTWQIAVYQDQLEPLDDVIQELESQYGPFSEGAAYLAKLDGTWRALPTSVGSQSYCMVSRLDYWQEHTGLDLQALFPASERDQATQDRIAAEWTYDNFLDHVKKLHAAGQSFGNPIGATSDSQDWIGPLFLSFGSTMVDAEGNVTVDSDATRAALEYMKELVQHMPQDVYAWDDAGNNRWLVSGNGSCIQNPPSAWTVAKRDAPEVAEQCWHHDVPAGSAGRYRGSLPYHWMIWDFAENKQAAKDLLLWLQTEEQMQQLVEASQGYDLPQIPDLYTFDVWEKEGPPPGGIYNYPVRGDEELITAGYPAPPTVGASIYNESLMPNMVARVTQGGDSVDDAIIWAEDELAGYLRG
jgi:ABC-type glycerol-3-phosphate transport system substrate-binding protein